MTAHHQDHSGISVLELIVALTLLTIALTVGTQVVVRAKGVLDDHRDYRLALDEVSNVVDVLTSVPADELQAQLESLQPGPAITSHLDNAEITATVQQEDLGTRIEVQLSWGPTQQAPKAVVLSGWRLESSLESSTDASEEGDAS